MENKKQEFPEYFNLRLTGMEVDVVRSLLEEGKHKVVNPVLATIGAQLQKQLMEFRSKKPELPIKKKADGAKNEKPSKNAKTSKSKDNIVSGSE